MSHLAFAGLRPPGARPDLWARPGVDVAGYPAAVWCLRVAVAAAALGLTGRLLSGLQAAPGPAGPESMSAVPAWIALVGGVVAGVCGAATLARPSRTVLLMLAALFGMVSVSGAVQGGALSYLSPAAHATRYLAPVALLLLLAGSWQPHPTWQRRAPAAGWLLCVAASATFAAHGVEAILHNPAFFELVAGSARNLFDLTLGQVPTRRLLYVIGATDLAVAGSILFRRWPPVLGYMACWGCLTAISRMTAHGLAGWDEALIRMPNAGVPLALLLLSSRRQRDSRAAPPSGCGATSHLMPTAPTSRIR